MTDRSRRNLLALLGTSGVGALAGCGSGGDSDGGGTPTETTEDPPEGTTETTTETTQTTTVAAPEEITLSEGDSIQAAVERVAEGGRVVAPSATFTESVTVEKALTLTTSDGATIDGTDVDAETAITVAASGVTIEGFEVIRFAEGIRTAEEVEAITVSDVTLANLAERAMQVTAGSVSLSGVTAEDNGGAVQVRATREGEVSVTDTEVVQSGAVGLSVTGGTSVTLRNLNLLQNGAAGLAVKGGDARGQTVELSDSSVIESGADGVTVSGTDGEDTVRVTNTNVEDGGRAALSVNAETVELTGVSAAGHGPTAAAIDVTSTREGSVTVSDLTVEDTQAGDGGGLFSDGEYPGSALHVVGGTTVTVENATVLNTPSVGVSVEPGETLEQTVELTGVTVENTDSGNGVYVSGASEATITDVETTGAGYGGINVSETGTATLKGVTARSTQGIGGLNVDAETVTVDGAEVRGNTMDNAAACDINVLNGGTATVRDVTVADSEAPTLGYEGGLYVHGGETVTVSNASCTRNPDRGIRVEPADVTGQTVEITDSTANENGTGVYVDDPGAQGEVTVESTTANNNEQNGFTLGGQNVLVRNCSASGNGEAALSLLDIERGAATLEGNAF